jgi:hypothetical protein
LIASSCAYVFGLVQGRETADGVERSASAGTAKNGAEDQHGERFCGGLEMMMMMMMMVTMMTMLSLRLLDLL